MCIIIVIINNVCFDKTQVTLTLKLSKEIAITSRPILLKTHHQNSNMGHI